MNKFSGLDYVVGVCAWIIFVSLWANRAECQKLGTCGTGDMVLFGIIAVSMLAPAWVAMLISSSLFGSKK